MIASRGYIALISVIIISALLLIIASAAGQTGFFSRYTILDSEYKERSTALAEACADAAILKLVQDPGYNPANEVVPVGSDACTIVSLQKDVPAGGQSTIKTQAVFPASGARLSYAYIKVVIDYTTFVVASWEETPLP